MHYAHMGAYEISLHIILLTFYSYSKVNPFQNYDTHHSSHVLFDKLPSSLFHFLHGGGYKYGNVLVINEFWSSQTHFYQFHKLYIKAIAYYNYHGHSKKNPNPKKENKMGGYDGISCKNIISNPWKLITLLIFYFKYFCCNFAPNRCHPMSSSPFFAYTLGCVDEGLQVFIIFYVMGIV